MRSSKQQTVADIKITVSLLSEFSAEFTIYFVKYANASENALAKTDKNVIKTMFFA